MAKTSNGWGWAWMLGGLVVGLAAACGGEDGGRTDAGMLPTGITSLGTGGDDGSTGASGADDGDETGPAIDCTGDEDCPDGQH